jgi:CDP-diacylglycerol--serine O-phosphatidyltransferase
MLTAGVLDFFDGFVARALKVGGDLGKQLDSLADMVTFGALPGVMIFQFISIAHGNYYTPITERPWSELLVELTGLVYTIFAAMRLAKFNIDTNQSDSFIGIPSPAAAFFVGAFPLVMQEQYLINMYNPLPIDLLNELQMRLYWGPFDKQLIQWLQSPGTWVGISLFLSIMMVAPVTMLNFKFKEFSWAKNKARFIFLGFTVVLLLGTWIPYWHSSVRFYFLDYLVIPLIILAYMLFSIANNFLHKKS